MTKPLFSKDAVEKVLIAVGLVSLSGLLYLIHHMVFGGSHDPEDYADEIFLHVAFLPIHALVLGIIIDGLISFRETSSRNKKFNMFLGIFFRQLGAEVLAVAADDCRNRTELEEITLVGEHWKARDFRRARMKLQGFKPLMGADETKLIRMLNLLREREADILTMTRNPLALEYDELHDGLISLLHLIEEIHYRGTDKRLNTGERQHLAKDVGKAMVHLEALWLSYLEHLKAEHPVLFTCQVGVCSTIGPQLIEDRLDQ